MHDHTHVHCDHNLKYCSICDVVYCTICHEEWGKYKYYWGYSYPYTIRYGDSGMAYTYSNTEEHSHS